MIKGVFFDVGGTLYSYRNLSSTLDSILQEVAVKLELEHDVADVVRHYRLANKEMDQRYADKPGYLFRDYFKDIFTGFLQRLDRSHQHHHFDWFEALQRDKLIGCMELQADCHDSLDRLKAMGLYLSAVSNADDNQLAPLIERGELHRWLTHWTSSEEAKSCKPDRRFYELALQKSGLTPAQVVFVGDSLEQDITGAHAVGMTTVLITEPGIATPMHIGREVPDPNYRISQLSELPAILQQLA